jgi:hypothetical protein
MDKIYGGEDGKGSGTGSEPNVGWWKYFFSTDEKSAISSVKGFFNGTWNTISDNVWNKVEVDGKTTYTINWDLIPNSIKKLCGDPASEDVKNSICYQHINKSLLALAGISLGMYLYVKLKGTKKEKAILERRLRDARRLSEDTSDDTNTKSLRRRKTGRLRAYSELSDSFSEESPKRRPSRRNRQSANRRSGRYTSRRR